MEITKQVAAQRAYFLSGATRSIDARKAALAALRASVTAHEKAICDALYADLHKSAGESYMAEIGLALSELSYMEKHVSAFAKNKRVATPLAHFPSRSYIAPEPLGVCLIMSPWNYPFMLAMSPLVGAIAAGNCVVLKPSAYAPHTSAVLREIIRSAFSPEHVLVVEGGRAENSALLEEKFDHIFFTGSLAVGKHVMQKAAEHLTPVLLELGGKSPCIVDETADLSVAAHRIAFGKYLNAGQTCVAPDYLFIHESVKEPFLRLFGAVLREFYGEDALQCPQYGKIINQKHFDRVLGLTKGEHIVYGGTANAETLQIAPTVLDGITPDSAVMQEEIFGPILPVLTFTSLDEPIAYIQQHAKPLALYLFTQSKAVQKRVLGTCSFGGGCINDTVIHLATSGMGFGGVGDSGFGSYHGKLSFDVFTHYRSIVHKANWLDMPMRYPPITDFKQRLIRLFVH